MQTKNLTPEQEEFVKTKLSNKAWRLNNLYKIKNKDGRVVTMKLNDAQTKLTYKFKHNRKIILKSRQQGISTYYLASELDDCLFDDGIEAGIQSIGQDEAEKLARRALLMWDEFDPDIKALLGITLITNNSKGMSFSNGSILKIGNFRGDTLQRLHVSELGKIAKKYPEKAKELKTGAFQAVSVSNHITIESTAEGKEGLFAEMWFIAYAKALSNLPLTPLDFQAIFLSWVYDNDCAMNMEVVIPDSIQEYFDKIEKELDIILTQQQKWWYAAKSIELGEDIKREYPATPEEAFEQSVEGTILRQEYKRLFEEGRVQKDLAFKDYPTSVSYDLGVNDTTVLTFVQKPPNSKPRVVFEYENSGEGLEFYVDIMRRSGFNITVVYLPHDANVRDFSTGVTRIDMFRRLGVPAVLLKRHSHEDYIQALRYFINNCLIDERCERLITAIQTYRWKFDKMIGVYLKIPQHDQVSNNIDSLKYMAIGLGMAMHGNNNSNQQPQKNTTSRVKKKGYSV